MSAFTDTHFKERKALFDVLEIKSNAVVGKGFEEARNLIRKRYHQLVLKHHPDKGGNMNVLESLTVLTRLS